MHECRQIGQNRLKELVVNTPIEVFVGALIGIVVPLVIYHKGNL